VCKTEVGTSMPRRKVALAVLTWVSCLVTGVLVGPRVHVLFWGQVLERAPSPEAKITASGHLAATAMGIDSLYDHLASRHSDVRSISAWRLASTERPDVAVSLLCKVPEARARERTNILLGMADVPNEYRHLRAVLEMELRNRKNSGEVRKEISRLIRSLNEVSMGGDLPNRHPRARRGSPNP